MVKGRSKFLCPGFELDRLEFLPDKDIHPDYFIFSTATAESPWKVREIQILNILRGQGQICEADAS